MKRSRCNHGIENVPQESEVPEREGNLREETTDRNAWGDRVRIGSVLFYAGTLENFVSRLGSLLKNAASIEDSLCISATGAHGVVTAQRDAGFSDVINSFWTNLPDGVPAVWLGHLKGMKSMERCYGPTFFQLLVRGTGEIAAPFFLCGGKPGVADELASVCASSFGNKQCVGTYSPPFRAMTEEEWSGLARRVESTGAKIVWIGLSTPKQEYFAWELARRVKGCFIITVGAAFDFHTGRLRQAPKIIQRLGLEWFFRLLVEPRRLAGRYAVVIPGFIQIAITDLVQYYFHKRPKDSA